MSSLLIFSYILLGAYALIVQVVCIREMLVVFYGNELCLGIIFAGWLFGVALGAGIAARIVDRIRQNVVIYLLLLMWLCVFFPLQIYGIRILRDLLHVPPGELIAPIKLLIGALSTITPFSIFVGAIFPVACRVLCWFGKNAPQHSSNPIGQVYIAEAVGSMIGGVSFTFALVTRYNAFQIAALAGCLVFLTVALLAFRAAGKLKFALRIGVVSILGSILYGYAFWGSPANTLQNLTIAQRWASMHRDITFVKSVDSKYENLSLGFQAGQYVLFTNGHYAAVFPDEYNDALLAHFYLTEHPSPRRVLLLGGGTEGWIAEILKHPIESLDYVELDPQLNNLLFEYLPQEAKQALQNPRVTVIYADGRYYVKQTDRRYDLIIINIPDPTNAMLNRFYTLEFFEEVKRRLNARGVVITAISASLHLQADAANYTGSLYHALRAVFPYVLVNPGTTNTYFATSEPDVITFDASILARRYRERGVHSDYFSEYHYDTLLQPEQIAYAQKVLQGHQWRLNTDFQPITYFYSLLLWTQFSETAPERASASIPGKILHALSRLSVWYFFAPIILFVLVRLIYVRIAHVPLARRLRFNCLWAIGVTGLAGMALELIVMFAFQNIYGYIYQQAGLIVAVFMVGLAAGGYVSHKKVREFRESFLLFRLLYVEIALIVFAALLPTCIRLLTSSAVLRIPMLVEIVFMLFVGIAGMLTGLAFPLASVVYLHSKSELGETAGMIDSADHLGALCGSLLVGVLFVPLLGVAVSCYMISVLHGSSVVLLCSLLKRATPGVNRV